MEQKIYEYYEIIKTHIILSLPYIAIVCFIFGVFCLFFVVNFMIELLARSTLRTTLCTPVSLADQTNDLEVRTDTKRPVQHLGKLEETTLGPMIYMGRLKLTGQTTSLCHFAWCIARLLAPKQKLV